MAQYKYNILKIKAMNKIHIIIGILIWCSINGYSQVQTPNGSIIYGAFVRGEEHTQYDKNIIKEKIIKEHPRATIIEEATTTYNCHAYAWHITEGGSRVWMNAPVSSYWQDGSYTTSAITLIPGTKVAYTDDDHSAIIAEAPDVFISKWGDWCLVKHKSNYGPYIHTNLRYYKRNYAITGDFHFYSSATFRANSVYSTSNVAWSVYPTSLSLSPNGRSCTVSGNHVGAGWIEANIDNSRTVRSYFVMGKVMPDYAHIYHETSNGPQEGWCDGIWITNKLVLSHSLPSLIPGLFNQLKYKLRLMNLNTHGIVYTHPYDVRAGDEITISYVNTPSIGNWYDIQVRLANSNDNIWTSVREVPYTSCSTYSYAIYPNPSQGVVYLRATDENSMNTAERSKPENVALRIVSLSNGALMKSVASYSFGQPLDVSGLPNGNYVVSVIKDDIIIESLKMIIQK